MSSKIQPFASAAPARRLKDHLRARRERVESLRGDLFALLETDVDASRKAAAATASGGHGRTVPRSLAATASQPQTATRDAISAARGQLGAVRSLGSRLR